MDKIMELKAKRFAFLKKLYEITGGDQFSSVDMWELGNELGFAGQVTELVVQYLVGEKLVEYASLGGGISITHWGVTQVEEALSVPNKPTQYFPPINIINVDKIIGSQIQQGITNSEQTRYFNTRQLMLEILMAIKNGTRKLHATNFSISNDEFGDTVEMIQNDGLISAATVQRGGQGNNVVFVYLDTAKITIKGLEYIEKNNKIMETSTGRKGESMSNKVFIIHGHDNEMKSQVQLLLSRAKLDDVVLHEQPDRSRTIIDKLIEESKDAVYVIALLSPDDLLQNGDYRARQNVILEIGYFIGKLGKEKVRLLKKENVEMPSDLQGILYENYDVTGAWKIKLLKEMQAVGIDVDTDSVLKKY